MNKESPLYIVAFMIILCVVFSFAIAFIYYSTLDMLKSNEALHVNKILTRAFALQVHAGTAPPGRLAEKKVPSSEAAAFREAIANNIEMSNLDQEGRIIRAFRNKQNQDVGFIWSGTGFWDTIKGVIVFSRDLTEIKALQILEQKETPGLGARIEEKWYTEQFSGLKIDWDSPMEKRIVSTTRGSKKQLKANRVDAITGATQTSIAMIEILNKEIDLFRKAYKIKSP